MNEEDFENKLRALTSALHRPDPTPAWKADILARARREADAAPHVRMLPPRSLVLSWAAAWVAILTMNVFTQRDSLSDLALNSSPVQKQPSPDLAPPHGGLPMLVALQQQLNLNRDLP